MPCGYRERNPEMEAFLAEYLKDGRRKGLQESSIVPLFKRPQPYPSVYTTEEILKIESSVDRDSPHGNT